MDFRNFFQDSTALFQFYPPYIKDEIKISVESPEQLIRAWKTTTRHRVLNKEFYVINCKQGLIVP